MILECVGSDGDDDDEDIITADLLLNHTAGSVCGRRCVCVCVSDP